MESYIRGGRARDEEKKEDLVKPAESSKEVASFAKESSLREWVLLWHASRGCSEKFIEEIETPPDSGKIVRQKALFFSISGVSSLVLALTYSLAFLPFAAFVALLFYFAYPSTVIIHSTLPRIKEGEEKKDKREDLNIFRGRVLEKRRLQKGCEVITGALIHDEEKDEFVFFFLEKAYERCGFELGDMIDVTISKDECRLITSADIEVTFPDGTTRFFRGKKEWLGVDAFRVL